MQLRVGESPGIDGIPAEVYQHGGEAVFDKLQDLFTNCWKGLYCRTSGMQSLSLCAKTKEKNQTVETIDASLLSVSGKIMARVLLNRLLPTIAQENTPESQRNRRHDLRAEADTGEMQRTEHRSICSFLRSDQGFGTVSRDGPWKSLARLGFPQNFLPTSASSMVVRIVR